MISPSFRRLIFFLILLVSSVYLILIWCRKFSLISIRSSESQIDAILGTAIQTTTSICGVILALIFLTAQLSINKPHVVRTLYRSVEVHILIFFFVITIFLGYTVYPLTFKFQENVYVLKVISTVLILSIASVFLVIPVLALQIENLIPLILASKLSKKITPEAIIDYGLTSVEVLSRSPLKVNYQLITVGLNPRFEDPFRPLHEVLMDAVSAKDRVLFGKLFLHFLRPIAKVHNIDWRPNSNLNKGDKRSRLYFLSRKSSLIEQVHTTLAVLHYAVKRARNLKQEWELRDTGRHGIINGIATLTLKLLDRPDTEITIRIALYAVFHISKEYKDVQPYGRIEPLNSFFQIATYLDTKCKFAEAFLCTEILAWISVHTKQIATKRSLEMEDSLSHKLKRYYKSIKLKAASDEEWVPGCQTEDPWRSWLNE